MRDSYDLQPIERAVMSYKDTPSSQVKVWPQTIYFAEDKRAFNSEIDRTISDVGAMFPFCMETLVLRETGDLHQDPALQPIIEGFVLNAATALGRPNATTCAELADLCDLPDARLLRVTCGETCGCTDTVAQVRLRNVELFELFV